MDWVRMCEREARDGNGRSYTPTKREGADWVGEGVEGREEVEGKRKRREKRGERG